MNKVETVTIGGPAPSAAGPAAIALLCLLTGAAMAAAGVYLLFGLGWSLVIGSVPFIVFALSIFRGLKRGS